MNDLVHALPSGLSNEEAEFVYACEVLGMPPRVAAEHAGMPAGRIVAPHIVQARELAKQAMRGVMQVTKEDITYGYQEAIAMARQLADPLTMMVGYEKLAKLHGLEQPTRVDVNISATLDVIQKQARSMSDGELVSALGAGDVIDGVFYEVRRGEEA